MPGDCGSILEIVSCSPTTSEASEWSSNAQAREPLRDDDASRVRPIIFGPRLVLAREACIRDRKSREPFPLSGQTVVVQGALPANGQEKS